MRTKPILTWMLLPLAFAAVSGCATHALWTEANLGTWHEPDSNSPMRLFRDGQSGELLVLYKESPRRRHPPSERAYFLYKNEHRIDQGRHPVFVKVDSARNLEPVPVFPNAAAAAAAPSSPVYAVLSTNKPCFTLYSSGAPVGLYALPVYYDGMGRMERIALTPLAVTADLTIVGGAAVCFAGYAVAQDPTSLNSIKIK